MPDIGFAPSPYVDAAAQAEEAERAILPTLINAAATSIDRQIIRDGINMGMHAGWLDVKPEHPSDIDIIWLRFRAACARAEMRLHPEMTAYLRNRSRQADAEATARANAGTR